MSKLTASKAMEMLKNPPHGKRLSSKQKKYFQAVAHGMKPYENGGKESSIVPIEPQENYTLYQTIPYNKKAILKALKGFYELPKAQAGLDVLGMNFAMPQALQNAVEANKKYGQPQNQEEIPNPLNAIPGMIGKGFNAFQELAAEKQDMLKKKQWKGVTDVNLVAANLPQLPNNRRWLRPEEGMEYYGGDEFSPSRGIQQTGIGGMAKYGKNIKKAQGGLYSNSLMSKMNSALNTKLNLPTFQQATSSYGKQSPYTWQGTSPSNIQPIEEKPSFWNRTQNFMENGTGQDISGAATNIAKYAMKGNAGSQFGDVAADALNFIPGVGQAASAIARPIFNLVGGLLDPYPRKAKKYQSGIDRNVQNMMLGQGASGIHSDFTKNMRIGGQLRQSDYEGEFQAYDGELETLVPQSPYNNMQIGQMVGDPHELGGIKASFGGKMFEGEGNEPYFKDESGDLNILGDLKFNKQQANMMGDDHLKRLSSDYGGKRFKNIGKDIASKMKREQNSIDRNTNNLNELQVLTPFDKVKFDTFSINIKAGTDKLKNYEDDIYALTSYQNSINDTAKEMGLKAGHLADRGRIKRANNKELMEMAAEGKQIKTTWNDVFNTAKEMKNKEFYFDGIKYDTATGRPISSSKAPIQITPPQSFSSQEDISNIEGYNEKYYKQFESNKYAPLIKKYFPKEQWMNAFKVMMGESSGNPTALNENKNKEGKVTSTDSGLFQLNKRWHPESYKSGDVNDPEHNVKEAARIWKQRGWREWAAAKKVLDPKYTGELQGSIYGIPPLKEDVPPPPPGKKEEIPPPPGGKDIPPPPTVTNTTTLPPVIAKKKEPFRFMFPNLIPKRTEPLDTRQLVGEMYALGNQEEPVPAQLYHPQLDTPYRVSLQDILNENTATSRAAQRMAGYNPAAQSAIAAQQYKANQGVLGEEFRINQANAAGVYNKNRDLLNQAQLTNLGILDTQYQRQALGRSNYEAIKQSALSSIADKYQQKQLENRKNAVVENLYNYRFGKDFRAQNWNGPEFFDWGGSGSSPAIDRDDLAAGREPLYVKNAKTDEYELYNTTSSRSTKKPKMSNNGSIIKAIRNL